MEWTDQVSVCLLDKSNTSSDYISFTGKVTYSFVTNFKTLHGGEQSENVLNESLVNFLLAATYF